MRGNQLWIMPPPFLRWEQTVQYPDSVCLYSDFQRCAAVMWHVSFMHSFPYNYSVSCELQTQIWLNEYIIHADRLNTVPESSRCVYVTFYCHSSTRWFGRLNSSLSDKLCESTMQIGQTSQSVSHTDWSFTHNNLHGNPSSCHGNCLLTVSPSAWCESGGFLGDNLRE